jgi:Icc-related predicted phosphoesterase
MVKSLYVMSDTHDDLEAVARAVDFAKSEGKEGSRIVHVGDLALRPYTKESLDKLVKDRDFENFILEKREHNEGVLSEYKDILNSSGMPFTVIPGNYDGNLNEIFGDADIHNKIDDWNGVRVIGYGAGGNLDEEWIGPGHMQLLVKLGEIEMFNGKELDNLLKKNKPSIAVIHNPPYGFCDDMFNGEHVGTPTTTRYMQENDGLKLVLSGHIHEAGPNANNPNGVNGISGIQRESGERTIVVNPGNLGRFGILNPQTLDSVREFDYGTFVRVDIEEDGEPVRVKQYSVQEDNNTIGKVREIGDFDLQT